MAFPRIQKQERINDPAEIDQSHIARELTSGTHVIVQFSRPIYTERMLSQLNDLCAANDENFGVRFYSFPFDCQTLLRIPEVKCLYVDCMIRAENTAAISGLRNLRRLFLGIYELRQPQILATIDHEKLWQLFVGETFSKTLDLAPLRHFRSLTSLSVADHTKNIRAIGDLKNLNELGLSSIKKTDLEFVNQLKKLRTLRIILGGRENIHEIRDNEIEHLEIIWVRGFNDISNISCFRQLRTLKIEDQIRLEQINFARPLVNMTDLMVQNCRNLTSITGLKNLLGLQQIRIGMTKLNFDEFLSQEMPKSLKVLAIYTGRTKANEQVRNRIAEMGYTEF